MRVEGDGEAAQPERAGAVDDLVDQLQVAEVDAVEIADGDDGCVVIRPGVVGAAGRRRPPRPISRPSGS